MYDQKTVKYTLVEPFLVKSGLRL